MSCGALKLELRTLNLCTRPALQYNRHDLSMSTKGRTSVSPAPQAKPVKNSSTKDYGSEGVKDNDITNLSATDYEILGAVTAVAFFVRLFRIYQPSSVVFDEVQ